MQKIGVHNFNFGQKFYKWFGPLIHLQLIRFYMGVRANYHNMYLTLNVYDPTRYTHTFVEAAVAAMKQDGMVERETVLGIALRDNQQSVNGWVNKNYLDSVGPRTHLIMEGSGTFTCIDSGASLDYSPGDIILVSDDDFGKRFSNTINDTRTVQLITCWGKPNTKKNWELFTEYERAAGIKGARD